jgi:hypothetical protein
VNIVLLVNVNPMMFRVDLVQKEIDVSFPGVIPNGWNHTFSIEGRNPHS